MIETPIVYEQCPCCITPDLRPYGEKANFRFQMCNQCRFVFVNPRPDASALIAYYGTAGGHGINSVTSTEEAQSREASFPNSTIDALRIMKHVRKMIPDAISLLDVGAGYGYFSKEAIDVGFIDVVALEFDEDACRICKDISGVSPISDSFESFESPRDSFDCILMSQVLEHASDIRLWIDRSRSLLTPNGVLVVAVPNFASFLATALKIKDPFVIPPDHLNYFNGRALSRLVEKSGFEVLRIETVSRVRPDILTTRLPIRNEPTEQFLNKMTSIAQRPPFALVNRVGRGLFLNVYATPRAW